MKLQKARVRDYRSILDSGWFDVESTKTILVGPNEAGKTVLLKALQQIKPPDDVPRFDPLRDYPRSKLSLLRLDESSRGTISPRDVTVVEAHFQLDSDDRHSIAQADSSFNASTYVIGRRLDNRYWHKLIGVPRTTTYADIMQDLLRLAAHADSQVSTEDGEVTTEENRLSLDQLTAKWIDSTIISGNKADSLLRWLEATLPSVDEENTTENNRYQRLLSAIKLHERLTMALTRLYARLPVFVYFSSYFRVHPSDLPPKSWSS